MIVGYHYKYPSSYKDSKSINLKNIFYISGRDLLNLSSTEPSLALSRNLTLEIDKEYTIVVTANMGEKVIKNFLWTDVGKNNYSQLPYQLVVVET